MKRMLYIFLCGVLAVSLLIAAESTTQENSKRNLEVSAVSAPAAGGQRVALVIGNSAYGDSPLKNPVNDAEDVAAKLRVLGFEVIERNNLHSKQIGRTLREFRSKLTPGAVALVFYAGHGLQIKGENYLPAVDAEITSEEDVLNQSLSVRQIMDVLDDAKTRLNLVFLDACRNNPYSRNFRSAAGGGLARISAPSGTLISYATRPGSVAADGIGRNGLYTSRLLNQLDSTQPVELALKQVVSEVKAASQGEQEPWMEGSIEGDFCFAGCNAGSPVQVTTHKPDVAEDIEDQSWHAAQESDSVEAYQAYLDGYPQGGHATTAKIKLASARKRDQLANQTKLDNSKPDTDAISTPPATVITFTPGQSFKDCPDCPEMLPIPGKDYAIGKYAVTQRQWKAIMGANPSEPPSCGDDCPVDKVSWNEAQAFIQKLSAKTGKQYRLPTDDEWNYSCRAGSQKKNCGSDNKNSPVPYNANSNIQTSPLGQNQPNEFGLYDMSGNVWEWANDCYTGDCPESKGGQWNLISQIARVANSIGVIPAFRNLSRRLRLARKIP